MSHQASQLTPDYAATLAAMRVLPARTRDLDAIAGRLLRFQQQGCYAQVSRITGVPESWMAASFEREASSDFLLSPAQGDPWHARSRHVPKNRGPFDSWQAAAVDAYRLNGLDRIGAPNWSWAMACFEGELFNGFGYRDWHHVRTPYLWGWTTAQQPGKYEADGVFNASKTDAQPGIIPIMMRMAELSPGLTLPGAWPFAEPLAGPSPPLAPPAPSPFAGVDVRAVQRALNARGFGQLRVDGSFGRKTSTALREFESGAGLRPDGLLDPATVGALLGSPNG